MRTRTLGVAVTTLLLAGGASAFHNATPAITAITVSGDHDLPRVPAQGRRKLVLIAEVGVDRPVVSVSPFQTGSAQTIEYPTGDNANPAVSFTGRAVAWDTDSNPLQNPEPGHQVIMNVKGALLQATRDPTGTSRNPSLDKSGRRVAFESQGDLAETGNPGARQIFVREKSGTIVQASTGLGTSRNPMLSPKGKHIVFQSTSDQFTGVDTGISQIWVGNLNSLPASPVTAGDGPSYNPLISDDGRIVVFESTADLAGSGLDLGIPQVFAYDTRSETFAQLTTEAGGCTRPAAAKVGRDWRITFICGGEAQYFMLRNNERYRVETPGGTSQGIFPEMGVHFVLLSTTADLMSGGSTGEHRIYMINLSLRPAAQIPGTANWFPFQGIKSR